MRAADAPPFLLEREAEIEGLDVALAAAPTGGGRLLLLEGAAGSGKTEILATARRHSETAGLQVLAARGSELEREVPFGVALELFGRPLQTVRPSDREALFRGAAALAAPLFAAGLGEEPPAPASNFPVVHGLYWLLANLTERSPLLVTVDDAHWADPSTLRFLLYLAERLDGLPVTLVVALSPEDASGGGRPLDRLRALPEARILHLDPLSKDAVATLARTLYFPDADDEFCRAIFDVCEGNPFVTREILRMVDLEGLPPVAASAERVRQLAPESVVRAARARISRVSAAALALAQAAAVLGRDALLRRAARLAGLDLPAAAAAAHELLIARVLRSGEWLEFVQAPLWSAVYSSIPHPRRAALHGQAAEILAEEDGHPERLGAHLLQSQEAGNPKVLALLEAAARRAVGIGAPGMAARYLRRALAEPPPPEDRARVLVELGRAEAMVGDADALDHLRRAVELLPDARGRAEALYEVGRTLVVGGRYREATEALRRGLDEVGQAPSELRRHLLAASLQATRLQPGSRGGSLLGLAVSAANEPDGAGSTPGCRALQGELAFEYLLAGFHFGDVRSAAQRALAGSCAAGETDALPFYNAVAALTWADDLDLADDSLDGALADAERRGQLMTVATASFRRATVSYLSGALSAAVFDAQRAVDASSLGWASYLPAARGILALALVEQGELARAAAVLERGERDQTLPTPTSAIFFQARSTLQLVEGAPDGALEDALTAERIMAEDLRTLTPAIVPWRSLASTAYRDLGQVAEARRLAAEEVELARRFGAPRPLGIALRVQGLVTAGTEGIELLREAADVLARSPARLEQARALTDLGSALRQAARPDAAGVLRRGLELSEACGAVLLIDRINEELKAPGSGMARRKRRSPAALTPAEERVARLVATGLSNKATAEKLFLSVRAIEFHLGNVYTKLGISSRHDLAAALTRADRS